MSNDDKRASHWLLLVLFGILWPSGSLMFESLGLLGKDQAWLVSGVIAAIIVFCIPERGKARDPRDLITSVVFIVGFYGILLKMRPWLANQIGGTFAAAVAVLLILGLAVVLWLLSPARANSRRDNSTHELPSA